MINVSSIFAPVGLSGVKTIVFLAAAILEDFQGCPDVKG
jgi:hypothetical protein